MVASQPSNREIVPDCPDGRGVITRYLKVEEGSRSSSSVMQCEKVVAPSPPFPALKMEEGGHKPWDTSGLWKLERARKQTLPSGLQKGTQPSQHLDFSPERPMLDLQPIEL